MKYLLNFIILLLLLEHNLIIAENETDKQIDSDCRKITNVTEQDLDLLDKFSDKSTDNAKCYLKCFFEKLGLWNNGAVQEDAFVKRMSSGCPPGQNVDVEKIKSLLNACKTPSGKNECDSVFQFSACVNKKMPQFKFC
ncbi:general odorant-binding protein 56a-like [Condylostylus longicornis]|uniref:general odorant-binding protein 56a-like n=1 Tax=Condylostylus longicornis TaxID=2530218 RepID=UPI00244DE88A|nr:general odorant-binding protein 56a-like [Condylostylus longicornis]